LKHENIDSNKSARYNSSRPEEPPAILAHLKRRCN